MKSLIIGLLCAAAAGTPPTGDVSNVVFIPNRDRSTTETVISGDVNNDGELNIADALILQQYLTSCTYEIENPSRLDTNFDGIIDSFDMILMRQNILSPENAASYTYSIDILNSADNAAQPEQIFTNYDDVYYYLSKFISDYSELETYLEKYDAAFFENNNLILVPHVQERGKGVYYNVSGLGKMHSDSVSRSIGDEIFITLSADYDAYKMLYPVTNTNLLIQIAVPKFQSHEGDFISVSDNDENLTNMSSHTYFSPDKKREILITQEAMNNISDIRVFLRNNKISFKALTFLSANGTKPFTDEGEWSVDSDGNNVFGNGTTYSITWFDNAISIDHQIEGNQWEKVFIPFDSEEVESEYYTK